MTTDLDTRLHMAAGSLHRAVENLPLEAAPRPSGRSPVVLGVVLLVVAAATTATVSATRGHDDGIAVPTDTVADVQALVASQVPEGFEVAWAGEQSAGAAADASVNGDAAVGVETGGGSTLVEGQAMGLDTYLYGTGGSVANPFAASDLVVNVWDASRLTGDAATQATTALQGLDGLTGTVATTVRGVDALVCAPPSCTVAGAVDDVTTVWWHETDDLEVVLASRSLTVDQVVAIAEGLAIDQEDVTLGALPAGLPGPLDEVGRLQDTAAAASDAVAQWVGYIDPANATGRYVDVTTLAGNEAELMALVWELGADQQVSVRGTDAWLALDDAGVAASADADTGVPQIDLVWQEASGVLVHVTSLGVGQDQVLDLVESLQTASDDQWADVKADVAAAADAAQAAAGAQVDTGGASAGVVADTGAGDDAEANAGVSASAGASGAGVDAQAGVADVAASLHADLGTEAVIGGVQSTVEQTAAAAAQAQAQLEEDARSAGAGGLLP